jgi:hypothetical protein
MIEIIGKFQDGAKLLRVAVYLFAWSLRGRFVGFSSRNFDLKATLEKYFLRRV